jgi:hypothetical protein
LREITFICANINSQIRALHISGQDNRLSDWLSRAPVDINAKNKLQLVIDSSWTEYKVTDELFVINNNW